MKKKMLLLALLTVIMLTLSSCASFSGSTLESMFRKTGTQNSASTVLNEDGVTISREKYEQYKKFDEVIELMEKSEYYFYKDVDEQKLLDYAARGLMAGLDDPYSFYYNPEEYAEMWKEDEGVYGGIGLMIMANYSTQICTIRRVFRNSPAEAAGVQRGDILYRIGEDLFVTADNLQEAVNIMRGEPGSSVDVTFLRKGEEITFTIPREIINVNYIEEKMIDDKVGYIAFYEFSGNAEKEFQNALNILSAEGAEGIIIDMRDNGGGWVEQARYIADLFMDEGELCYLVYRDGTEDHMYKTKNGKTDVKLVLIVNENSASSSEILTGALKECADATIVGTKTFGKGIVQNVMSVGERGAGFQITVAQYYTPNGYAVHQKGIDPDVVVELDEDDNGMYDFCDVENDPQLKKALEVMYEKLK